MYIRKGNTKAVKYLSELLDYRPTVEDMRAAILQDNTEMCCTLRLLAVYDKHDLEKILDIAIRRGNEETIKFTIEELRKYDPRINKVWETAYEQGRKEVFIKKREGEWIEVTRNQRQ